MRVGFLLAIIALIGFALFKRLMRN